jgi:hypothetical protein
MPSKNNLEILDFPLLESFWKKVEENCDSACHERGANLWGRNIGTAIVQAQPALV